MSNIATVAAKSANPFPAFYVVTTPSLIWEQEPALTIEAAAETCWNVEEADMRVLKVEGAKDGFALLMLAIGFYALWSVLPGDEAFAADAVCLPNVGWGWSDAVAIVALIGLFHIFCILVLRRPPMNNWRRNEDSAPPVRITLRIGGEEPLGDTGGDPQIWQGIRL